MAILHIVRFRLVTGADEAAFRAANESFQREAKTTLPGLERRESARSADGEWVLVLRYRDLATAKAQGAPTEAGRTLMSLIDKGTMSNAFYEVASE